MSKARRVSLRICVLCRERKPKHDLLRLVRGPDGECSVDRGGRMSGRGCYVCFDQKEIQERNAQVKIKRALKLEPQTAPELFQEILDFIFQNAG